MERALNAWQVAAMLVSASYGIGFLFGSGEMALTHGMGGSIYGLVTAVGMLVLSLFAARLWNTRVPIWDLFGRAYGNGLKNSVALLSVIWMAGVLAAQIHGGVAIVKLLGLADLPAHAAVLTCIYGASRLNLRAASSVFSLFLFASSLVLIGALITGKGGEIYLQSPVRFVTDLRTFHAGALISIVIAVLCLVCTGADYHQFVLSAKRPAGAVWGCLLAGLCLVALSVLPASIVLALKEGGGLTGLVDAKQVIPFALSRQADQFGRGIGHVMLLGLSAAALGSGAAIVRAMTSALHAATSRTGAEASPGFAPIALVLGATLAARGQEIVATMVSVNVIYIGSIAVVFAALLAGQRLTSAQAGRVMAAGFAASSVVYATSWAGPASGSADLLSLIFGLAASASVFFHALLKSPLERRPHTGKPD